MNNASFEQLLKIGGKSNSLGEVVYVINEVLAHRDRLDELYLCMFDTDPWVRMRAADAFEKICRIHPDWIEPYIDRIQNELSDPTQQPSIQWHIAQLYEQVSLTTEQTKKAVAWLVSILSSNEIDWIVSANTMSALHHFVHAGKFDKKDFITILHIQKKHRSHAVIKKADKLLAELSNQ